MSMPEIDSDDPLVVFRAWLAEAVAHGVPLPERTCLATADRGGAPSARMVLFRGIEDGCFRFFTDYRSRKARELAENPRAALVFYWHALGRQVRVDGEVERLCAASSDAYFLTRGRGSRISAWTSHQSAEIEDRAALEAQRRAIEDRFEGAEVSRPPHWGGFGLRPSRVEFWSERPNRFHDRVLFRRTPRGWDRVRLQP